MNNPIHIPEKCSESWTSMRDAGISKRHCAVCKLDVHDFTTSSRTTINEAIALANSERVCGRYHERHTMKGNKLYFFLNILEEKLIRFRLKAVAFVVITGILTLSGCVRRHTQGYAKIPDTHKKGRQQKESGS
ncbi:MAG: hypothetical protein ACJ77K_13095 [Bacteroidia bacterium]